MNIGHLLTKSARAYPHKLAVACGSTKWNYTQFNSRANRLANALCRLGIRRGDNVALLQYNNPDLLEPMWRSGSLIRIIKSYLPVKWARS